ncbi:MAG: hypothetical protein LIP09_05190 [Bacteroidales bacterium]|nr:hypothetical protein [Bacteroidales bacterium]
MPTKIKVDIKLNKTDCVGYFYDTRDEVKDYVFILPKVILDGNKDEKVLGKYKPEDLIEIEEGKTMTGQTPTEAEMSFLFEFSLLIYRTLKEFKRLNLDSTIVNDNLQIASLDEIQQGKHTTFLEIILEIVEFYKSHYNFLLFEPQLKTSGLNHINWRKTISKKQPILKNNKIVYPELITRNKVPDYDEELLVIFLSVVKHIKDKFLFDIRINSNFQLIDKERFEDYRNGYGITRLYQIRYRYFSDIALKMWHLCKIFFEGCSALNSSSRNSDYLVASDFEIIFEKIVEELLGDKDLFKEIKSQKDGKRVDHVFLYTSLIHPKDNTLYVVDSKYYKMKSHVEDEALYKQFTYIKNIHRALLDHEGKDERLPKCKDDETEGYVFIPNFFLSAYIDINFLKPPYKVNLGLKDIEGQNFKSINHFENRLFDRDSLLVMHFSLNFLKVLSVFVSNNSESKRNFKEEIQHTFYQKFLKILNDKFSFWKVKVNEEIKEIINKKFKYLNGKIYKTQDEYILALEREKPENEEIYNSYFKPFKLIPFNL